MFKIKLNTPDKNCPSGWRTRICEFGRIPVVGDVLNVRDHLNVTTDGGRTVEATQTYRVEYVILNAQPGTHAAFVMAKPEDACNFKNIVESERSNT